MDTKETETGIDHHEKRYLAALHAMQSGVAMLMTKEPGETTPKHLRTGVNAAMSDSGALVALLIKKGVFTLEEYYVEIADRMEKEKESYEKRLSELYGTNVTLL